MRGRDQIVGDTLRAASGLPDVRPNVQRALQFAGNQNARGSHVMSQPVRDLESAGGARVLTPLLDRPCASQKRHSRGRAQYQHQHSERTAPLPRYGCQASDRQHQSHVELLQVTVRKRQKIVARRAVRDDHRTRDREQRQ